MALNFSVPVTTNWKEFKGEELPEAAQKFAEKKDIFRSRWTRWIKAYYDGDINSENWIIVTDDGSYYKVKAKFCVWFGEGMRCAWTNKFAIHMLRCFMTGQNPGVDPNYHT